MDRTPADFVRTLLRIERDGLTGVVGVQVSQGPGVPASGVRGGRTTIFCRDGALVYATGGHEDDSLGRVLLDGHSIAPDVHQRLLDRMAAETNVEDPDMRFGELLVITGTLSLEEVRAGLTDMVARRLERCLASNNMGLTFNPSNTLPASIGRFPCAILPLVLRACYAHYDRARAVHYLSALRDAYLTVNDDLDALAESFDAVGDDLDLLEALDGERPLDVLINAELLAGRDPYPMLTALVLAAAVHAGAAPQKRGASTPRPKSLFRARTSSVGARPTDARPTDPIRARSSMPSPRTTDPRAQSFTGPPDPSPRFSGRSTIPRGSVDPPISQPPMRPQIRSDPSGARRRSFTGPPSPTSSQPAAPRHPPRDHAPGRIGTDPRRTDPGFWDPSPSSEPRARSSHPSLTPESQPRLAQPASGSQLSQLQAEQAFQRGLRYLRSEQLQKAADELARAAVALPNSLERQLYAKFAAYRCQGGKDERTYTRHELEPLCKLMARQDKASALPPYVLGYLALADGDDARALGLFKIAAKRDPANRDVERHVRLLSSRAGTTRKA